ncbi:MAG: 3-dehydroquinate synthase [Opitutaceae bacterium]|jgi:3-dehydroquinate synthase|nr:3-dehydroquinate synthase [Opitutaceae bacterium]
MSDILDVSLGSRSYPIQFGADLTTKLASRVSELREAGRKVVIITDESVAAAQAESLAKFAGTAAICPVPAGETAKSTQRLAMIWDFLAAQKMDRGGVVLAFGGGVVGDLAGFAAASYLRGVDFIQVPTTLLAMVDSSVGGKTGINLGAGKNLVGAFHQPQEVFVATDLLKTLPAREFAAGMAEVIKYGLLGDAELFEQLESEPLAVDSANLAEVVNRCCAAKARIVEADEFETAVSGGRALLNLGHTFGHAIEKVAGYSIYLHGEAVAIGLAAAARLSVALNLIDQAVVERVEKTLAAHDLPIRLREPIAADALLTAMASDKKVRAGKLRFVVMEAIGQTATKDDVESAMVAGIWREVGAD